MKERQRASPFTPGEPLDESVIEWDSVVEATYLVEQELRYDYSGPISDLRHRLVIVPRERHGDQRRLAHRLDVSPDVPAYAREDAFGNPVVTIAARLRASYARASQRGRARPSGPPRDAPGPSAPLADRADDA